MSHTSKSYNISNWGYRFIISVFVVSIFTFKMSIIAQTTDTNTGTKHTQNVLKFVVTKDTKDNQLESIKEKLAEKKATIRFENIIRNDRKELTGIQIDYDHNGKNGNFFINSDNPIKDIAISLNTNENELTVGQTMRNLSQSFEIIKEDDETTLKKEGSENNIFVYSTDDDSEEEVENISVVGKDGEKHEVKKERKVYVIKSDSTKDSDDTAEVVFVKKNKKDTVWIKKDVKNIVWTDDDGNEVEIITVEKGNNKNIQIFTNGEEQPLILLDGKEITKKDMESLKSENIESVNVLKGEKATEVHGKKGEHGVIEIILKKKD